MISKERKAFRSTEFNSNTDPKTIGYAVGEQFDEAGLPNPYIEDAGVDDDPFDDRDGRGLPTSLAVLAIEQTLSVSEGPGESPKDPSQDVNVNPYQNDKAPATNTPQQTESGGSNDNLIYVDSNGS